MDLDVLKSAQTSSGITCYGEIVTYEEYFYAPSDSSMADLPTYTSMFTDYMNSSNVTLLNITATFGMALEFLEHKREYFGEGTLMSPPTPPPHVGNPYTEPSLFDENGVRLEMPLAVERWFVSLSDEYHIAGKMRGDLVNLPANHMDRANCEHDDAVLVKIDARVLIRSEEGRTELLRRMYGVTIDAAFKRFDVRACFTERTHNIRRECDAAPSPPPKSDWVTPPSPPAFIYETITLATATGSSALFFLISAMCCMGAGRRMRRPVDISHATHTNKKHTSVPPPLFRTTSMVPVPAVKTANTAFYFNGGATRYNPVDRRY